MIVFIYCQKCGRVKPYKKEKDENLEEYSNKLENAFLNFAYTSCQKGGDHFISSIVLTDEKTEHKLPS